MAGANLKQTQSLVIYCAVLVTKKMKRCHPDSSNSDQNQVAESKQRRADTAVVFEEICRLARIIEDAKATDPNYRNPLRPDLLEVERKILELLPLLRPFRPAPNSDSTSENN